MRTRSSAIACIVLAVATVTAGGGTSSPQDPPDQSPPVFRAESDFIRVDMYATRDGELVTDLRPDEVQIFEDGIRQQALTFEYVHIPDGGLPLPARGAGTATGEEPGDPRSRVFVVFIDTHTTELEGDSGLRLSLVRFLDRLLRPDDLVALMTPDMPVDAVTLDRRSRVISDIANDVRWLEDTSPDRADLTEFAWESCYPSGRGSSRRFEEMKARRNARFTIDALHDLVWHLRDLREERKAVLLVTGGWPFIDGVALGTGGRAETRDCADDRATLSRMDYKDLLGEVTEAANRANVSFYPVSARPAFDPPEQMRASIQQRLRQIDTRERNAVRDQLRLLAEKTDGIVNLDRDFDRVAERVNADTSSYYLIGYQSSRPGTDGQFRSISVTVTRPNVRVRARSGYGGAAPALRVPVAPVSSAPLVDGRVVNALAPVERFDGLAPFWGRLSAWEPTDAAGGGAFWFVGELGLEARLARPWIDGATAQVVVLDANKTEVLTQRFDFDADEGAFMVRVPSDGRLAPGDYTVRVHLRPADDDQVNVHESASVTLATGGAGPGEAMIWRRGSSALFDFLLTADPRFRRTERLRLELPTTSTEPVSARLLDRFGRAMQMPLEVRERADRSEDFRWIVVEASLAALAPAYYTIEVTQNDTSRFTAFRIVP